MKCKVTSKGKTFPHCINNNLKLNILFLISITISENTGNR